jgi:hypothetical protein
MPKQIMRLFVASEMEAAAVWGNIRRPEALDELLLSVKGGWEFGIELVKLMDNKAHLRLKMYSDSWKALTDAPEIFQVLARFDRQHERDRDEREVWLELIAALEEVGLKRQKPEPREMPKPVVCQSCGRP